MEYIEDAVIDAMQEAIDAFYGYLEDKGYDGAYWDLSIDVRSLSNDFQYVLATYHWDNIERKR